MAFYSQVAEDRFDSSANTRGPWDPGSQHAGPPAALLGRAVEKFGWDAIARQTADLYRAVAGSGPLAPR